MAKIINSYLCGRVRGYNLYRDISDVDFPPCPNDSNPVVESVDMQESLFDLMFSVNPLTKLPQGDIAMYLSDKTSPDIKRFIELNLLSENGLPAEARSEFSALSDDDIAEFVRGQNESSSSYRSRIFEVLKKDVVNSWTPVTDKVDDATK